MTGGNNDIELMEAALLAAAERGGDIVPALFARFFAAYPDERAKFYNLDAASGRMTNETLEAMMGLAAGEPWVVTTVVNFVDLHRNYGDIPFVQYAAFVDMTVDTLAEAAGEAWTGASEQAWRAQAERLKAMIKDAC